MSAPDDVGGLEVLTLPVGAFQANCHLLRSRGPDGAVLVIDPGAEPERIASALDAWGVVPAAILLTHAHLDHVTAVGGLVERYSCPVYLHPADLELYRAAPQQALMFGLQVEPQPLPDRTLSDRQLLKFGTIQLQVRHAPGHSPGGVVFEGHGTAFVGDCVFAGSIGRTDLPGGDTETLLTSIREQILTLPGQTVLHSGHGPSTTVEREAGSNPFLVGFQDR
ncbi:MAG: MBL fold metallo-hydrolase [Gemmatimonadetes bacterium]|nr:MBL fold metallo-hydrolase [Gemmatimonadota bacterium]